MATTTNYSWTTPDDTDLVKDGAAAIRTLGSSADTTVKNLNPGTTAGDIDYYTSGTAKARIAIGTAGQVLKVNSGGTAPEWGAAPDQTPLTTKGDLFTFDTADARLGVGANGTVLTADSAETTGLKWASASSSPDYQLLNAGGTALTGATSITVSGITGKNNLFIYVASASSVNASSTIALYVNGDTTGPYRFAGFRNNLGTIDQEFYTNSGDWTLGTMGNSAANGVSAMMEISGCNATGVKPVSFATYATGTTTQKSYNGNGYYLGSSAITSVTVISSSGNFDAGTIFIYGA